MRKIISALVAVSMLTSTAVAADTTNQQTILDGLKGQGQALIQSTLSKFGDVAADEWYLDPVSKLVALGGINGYEDGTFRPTGTITRAECAAILARSLGIKPKDITGDHWAAGIMAAAVEAGLVAENEYNDITVPITRYEMARMAVRAIQLQKEAVPADYMDYTPLIYDLGSASTYRDDVAKVVTMGIISGYPDKTFRGTKTLSRAEASVVIMRILDPDMRKIPVKPSPVGQIALGETKSATEIISNMAPILRWNPDVKAVTLVTPESLGMRMITGIDNNPYIWLNGRTGDIAVINDGKAVFVTGGNYSFTKNITFYVPAEFGVDYKRVDYFGFPDGDKIKLVTNPWKE